MTSEHSPAIHAALDADYEIIHELGRGGTALVYLAREKATGDEVAIKVIRSRYIEDDEAQARFAREARLVAQLHHPNIVPVRAVLDLDTAGLAIVMAHVVGRTLKQRIKQDGPLSAEDAEQILRDVGGALSAAHANGIVHRDVKPENIFVNNQGRALLADFGLARSMTPDTALTMAGVALGTPAYMAPEQIDGNDLDARVDVYSLGLVAWEMLIGRRAWNGEGLYAILYHQKHELPPDVRELRDDVPDRLAEVIARAIEKTRDARWSSVRAMLDALDESTPLTLAPRRVSGGGETIRFIRPPLATAPPLPAAPPAPVPVFALDAAAFEPQEIEVPRRRVPVIVRTAAVVATLSVAAIATALVRNRANVTPTMVTDRPPPPILAGDVAKPVTFPAPLDTHTLARADTSRAPVTPMPAAPKVATRLDSAPAPSVAIPVLVARPPVAVNAAAATDKIAAANSSSNANSVWGGPAPLTLKAGIVAGGTHSCLINAVGQARCWGNNDHGQLGDASGSATNVPFVLDVGTQFVAVAAGSSHTCAIGRDGAAWCWGNNDHGQSGDRSLRPKLAPVRVADAHIFWAIAAGDAHTCALDAYGAPWCWGSNAHGQLGDPAATESAVPMTAGRGAKRFVTIAAGSSFTCALAANGRASCWGENGGGQLGDGSNFDRALPVDVASGQFTSIAAGSNHACGITADGEAYCWGRNTFGQLGDGGTFDRNTPVRVRGGARFTSITAGGSHTCAVAVDGTAYCWGQNTYGQLGTGSAADVAQPSNVADGHVFASVRAFGTHTCGLTTRGEALCWGNNAENQLGDGTQTHRARPVWVSGARDR
jgi:alpha-tubulin suppressor-like RCC1 family protein/tRNA A-37 threonylcarbamoyl transferase component Bud32